MSLDPFFSLSPLNPIAYTRDSAYPNAPYAEAYFTATGVVVRVYGWLHLKAHYRNDRLPLSLNPVSSTDQAINNETDDVHRRCMMRANFRGYNIGPNRQYLFVFRLKRHLGSPIAQFFIGTQFVRQEAITQATHDDISILLDAPENDWVHPMVRLAAPDSSIAHGFFFMGLDCYLL